VIIAVIVLVCAVVALAVLSASQTKALEALRRDVQILETERDAREEVRQAEECMRCIREGVMVVSDEGVILESNAGAEHILGAPGQSLLGRSVRDFYVQPSTCDGWLAQAREDGQLTERQALLRTSRGATRLVQTSVARMTHDDNSRFLQVMRDCADIESMEHRLVQSERLATIGRFAAQIAHEIRNPLASISLNLEMLEEEVDRLHGIVSEYLQFSRFPKPRPEEGRIDDVISELRDSTTLPSGMRLNVELTSHGPEIRFDKVLMRQVLDNLVRNAVEAIDGPGEIRISTDLIDRFLVIRVSDTGPGIPPDILNQLFEPFFTTKADGTGLGLATAQQIVFEHDGHIEAESEPGSGTTFSVYLPR
jgi:PAS domain S-box-containing protein